MNYIDNDPDYLEDEDERDEFDEPFDDEMEPDYYLCFGCGYSCRENHGAAGCPKCTAIMSPEHL